MRINKLHLQDFGKFHEKDIALTPGVNIIYGANEAGKTTTKDFIVDMIYGIDKSKGVGARFDHYEKRRPINGASYSGSMEFSTEDGEYIVERNFLKNEKKTVLRNIDTGREILLKKDHNLYGTVINTDKSTYVNTLCIGQQEAATDKEIADRLNNYIVNMASSKNGEIDAVRAIAELNNKKKAFTDEEFDAKLADLSSKLQLDRDFDGEISAVIEEYKRVEEELNHQKENKIEFTPIKNAAVEEEEERQRKLKEEEEARREAENPLSKREKDIKMLREMGKKSVLDNSFVILLLALLLTAVFVGVAYLIPTNVPQIKMGIIIFGIALALLTTIRVFMRRSELYKLLEELEIEQGFEEAKSEAPAVEDTRKAELANKLSELKAKQEEIVKERANQEEYMKEINELKSNNATNLIELQAIDLAIKSIQDLSEEIYESFGGILNSQVAEIMSKITGGKYSEVRIDDQLRVMVKSGNSFISMDYLSEGTIEQIYLALRLSIANVIINEDLPIIIDDIFVTYDEQRLYDTLSCIGEYLNRQIIIFTTNLKVQDIFNSLNVPNYSIAL